MNGDIRSSEAQKIIQLLAELPGSTEINVTSKKFPRFGPHVTGTIYEERTCSFAAHQLPERLEVPADAEEVHITVHGALTADAPADLLGKLNEHFLETGMSSAWGVRSYMRPPQQDRRPYELRVFM